MDKIIDFFNWFMGNQWINVAVLVIAIITLVYAAIPVHTARKLRLREMADNLPGVKAMVNAAPSVDGWRSVVLHITPPPAQEATFKFTKGGWCIINARLLSRNSKLAFAREGDNSLAGPIVGPSPRMMSGRLNHPQPFAMEFFMRFPGTPIADRGQRAKFRVKIGRNRTDAAPLSLIVWAEVPDNAQSERAI